MIGGFRKARKAVRDYIAEQTYSAQPVAVLERNTLVVQSERSTELQVFVTPANKVAEGFTRTSVRHAHRIHVNAVKIIPESNEANLLAAQDILMDLMDEIEQSLIAAKTVDIDARPHSLRIPEGTERVTMDEESMARNKTFWARVEIEVLA